MNTAKEILHARRCFMRAYVGIEPKIAINPDLLTRFLKMTDENGVHYVYVDPFDRSKWALLGMSIVEDSSVDHWMVFGVIKDSVTGQLNIVSCCVSEMGTAK
jgi:hypothetical protein